MRSELRQKQRRKNGFRWGFLILGILFVVMAALAFANPFGNLETVATAFAVLAVFNGMWLIFSNMGSALRIIAGVISILVGVFIFANRIWALTVLPYVFAVWFVADSLLRLFSIGAARPLGTACFVFSLVFSILGILLGTLLLFDPMAAVFTLGLLVGTYLLLAGVDCALNAFNLQNRPDL